MTEITHETSKSASTILSEAALLSKEEWTKRAYFRVGVQENIPCRCAHGQIQWCGRESTFQQEIKDRMVGVEVGVEVADVVEVAVGVGVEVADVVGVGVGGSYQGKNIEQWLTYFQQKYSLKFNRSLFLAHYYAGRVGLTLDYNDAPDRTFEEVI